MFSKKDLKIKSIRKQIKEIIALNKFNHTFLTAISIIILIASPSDIANTFNNYLITSRPKILNNYL